MQKTKIMVMNLITNKIKILSFLIMLSMVAITPVYAGCQTGSGEDSMWATACAYVSSNVSNNACVKSASITGSGSASYASKTSSLHYYLTESNASGIKSGTFAGAYSASVTITSGRSLSQTTRATLSWGSNSSAYTGDRVLNPTAQDSWSSDAENVKFDNSGPNHCIVNSMSGSNYVVNANGVFVSGPGASVTVNWDVYDYGCAGVSDASKTSSVTAPSSTGTYTISKSVVDTLGNPSSGNICSINYQVDSTGPNCSGRTITQSTWSWTRGPVTVGAYGCSDSGSGFKSCSSVNATGEDQTVTLACKDNLGNKTNISHTVTNIDISAPYCTGTGVTKPSAGIYVRTAVPAWGSCGDARSGCTAGTYYGNIAGGSGSIGLVDNVGNTGSCSISYDFWDGSKPTTTITFDNAHKDNSESQYTADEKITVTISAVDEGKANVDRVCYKLDGETTQAAVCHKGSSYSFDIKNEGITNITAWSFDKAYDYADGFVYNASTTSGGNRSDDVKKSAYIDRTKPNLTEYTADDDGTVTDAEVKMSLTSPYDNIKDTTPWVDTPIIVTVDSFDTEYRDGSSSGLGSVEYYWGITANPNEVWGVKHNNRKYNTNNQPTETIPTKALAGTVYGVNEVQYNDRYDYTPDFSNPANNTVLNDELYLHVRVCDRATTTNGQKAPNCTTAVYGPVYYDDMPPNIVTPVYPPEEKDPVNPPTDPDNPTDDPKEPVGGTGSEIVNPDDIPEDAKAMGEHDWTNRLVIAFLAYEHMQESEVNIGSYKKNSGIDKIEFYYDRNYNHESDNKNAATYGDLDNYRQNCSSEKVCAYYLDFNSLSNYPDNGSYKVMEEGNRFVKVRVHDIAGNYKDFYFGPYRFDITPNELSNIEFSGQTGTMIDK